MTADSSAASCRYVDLNGYALTGKMAVSDLLREFDGYWVHRRRSRGFLKTSVDATKLDTPYAEQWNIAASPTTEFADPFEFDLIRVPGGIRDLETALVDDWSPIRSSAAIARFKRLVERVGRKASATRPSTWVTAIGWNYDEYFDRQFFRFSSEYLDRLVDLSWTAESSYSLLDVSEHNLFLRRVKSRLGIRGANDFEVFLTAPRHFIEATQEYVDKLLTVNVPKSFGTVVVHNAVEPFQPARGMRYFRDVRVIIVDRDPRDNYVASLWYKPIALPATEFIRRYRLYREMSKRTANDGARVLRIRFEELVLEYERTVARILEFLGESASVHVAPKRFFDPAQSVKNVGLWKQYPDQSEIESIHRQLREFCVN